MIGWGLIGISAAWLGRWRRDISRLGIGVFGFVWGFVFGWMQNAGFWLLFVYPLNLQSYLATYVSSFFFDTAHALTNLLLCFLLFKPVVQVLREYKDRMHCAYKDA
ncbi:hypothetical protein [Syntrophomonas palmitatica]|uniref:hypothetical protein n=1 Tax=Syntrophomonas palmitatica TaxID=402877 RepID=UPI0006D0B9CE|nr:hypothetical protein [Syntrophomonas palmitatica]